MSDLPIELDFEKDKFASPARMNRAMRYIIAKLRAVESVIPAYDGITETLRSVGLERLNDALLPLFNDTSALAASLEIILARWENQDFEGDLVAGALETLRDGAPEEFDTLAKMAEKVETYRTKYLGAHATSPTLDDNGDPVAYGAMYYDTTVDDMRVYGVVGWKSVGSLVAAMMVRQAATATAGQTTFAVPGGYDAGNIIVAVNGLVLEPGDVTVTSGSNIVIGTPLAVGDSVTWIKFGAITLATVYTKAEVDAQITALAATLAGYRTADRALDDMNRNFFSRMVR